MMAITHLEFLFLLTIVVRYSIDMDESKDCLHVRDTKLVKIDREIIQIELWRDVSDAMDKSKKYCRCTLFFWRLVFILLEGQLYNTDLVLLYSLYNL